MNRETRLHPVMRTHPQQAIPNPLTASCLERVTARMKGKDMFGMKASESPEQPKVMEYVLDRIGLAEADAVNLEIWWVTFADQPGLRRISVNAIGMENKRHLVLARRGDRIRLTTQKGKTVGFENLDLGG